MSLPQPPLQSPLLPFPATQVLFSPVWSSWLMRLWQVATSVTQSGTTAQRPTKNLWPGRPFFDVSLGTNGKPIWVNKAGTGWVLADGTAA